MGLTIKQKAVLEFIQSYTLENGLAPTQREIKEHFNLKSFGSVQRYLKYLEEGGHLERDPNARRGTVVTTEVAGPSQSQIYEVPLLGDIAAGNPIEAIENPTETFSLPPGWVSTKGNHFALRIQGDSMIEDGILENDIVILKQTKHAELGQTIAAVIDGEATLKKYYHSKNGVELRPANQSYQPIVVDPQYQDFKIVGLMVGLYRSF